MLEAIVEAYFKHSTDVESAKPSEIWKNLTVQKKGWRVGCNLPSVLCGIRLIGLPAPWVESSLALICPLHLQDGRFTVSALHSRQLSMPHWHVRGGRFVSAPEPGLSPYTLAGVAVLHVGRVSSGLIISARKPHANSPAHDMYGGV